MNQSIAQLVLRCNYAIAAGRSVFAHLVELIETGKVVCDGPPALEAKFRVAR